MAYSRIKCPKCGDDFGQESRFLDHLTDAHGVADHLALYLDAVHGGPQPACACKLDCPALIPWAGWKKGFISRFARGHNARIDSVYLDKERQAEFVAKRTEGYATGRNKAWNEGLTKETDERVKLSAEKAAETLAEGYATGRLADWRLADGEKARAAAAKISATKRRQRDDGTLVVWNAGLTKETDPRLAALSVSLVEHNKRREAGRRVTVGELRRRVEAHSDVFALVSSLDDYRRRRVDKLQFRCVAAGHMQLKSLAMLEETPVCFVCHPKESLGQLELYQFVRSLAPDAVLSDRSAIAPKELDVFVTSHRLGIEYDGLYYHSAAVQDDPQRAQRKADACAAAGVRFMVIYEDDWRDRRRIVEGMLRHRLGDDTRIVHARKLSIVQLPSKRARAYFDANHLDGHTPASVTLALVDGDDVIHAALSLRRPFHRRYSGSFEVARSACLLGTSVPGWLGRLSRAAATYATERGKDGLITYVDGRVGVGSGYQLAGWRLLKASTGPRFWWTDAVNRYDRFTYRADASRGLTQRQAAEAAGVVQIHGCSNSLWRYP